MLKFSEVLQVWRDASSTTEKSSMSLDLLLANLYNLIKVSRMKDFQLQWQDASQRESQQQKILVFCVHL